MTNQKVVEFQKQNPAYAAAEEAEAVPEESVEAKPQAKKAPLILSPLQKAIENRKRKAANRAAARGNAVSNALRSSANASQNISNKTRQILAERNVRNAKKELSQAKPGFFTRLGRGTKSALSATSRALNPKRAFGSNEYKNQKLLENEQRRKAENTRKTVEKARINAAKAQLNATKKNLHKVKNPQKYPSPDLIAAVESSSYAPSAPSAPAPSAPSQPSANTMEAISKNSKQNTNILMNVLQEQKKIYTLLKEIVSKGGKRNMTRKK